MVFSERNGSPQKAMNFSIPRQMGNVILSPVPADEGPARSRPSGLIEEARAIGQSIGGILPPRTRSPSVQTGYEIFSVSKLPIAAEVVHQAGLHPRWHSYCDCLTAGHGFGDF